MKPITISHTHLKTFEQCPKKYYHLYVARDAPKEQSEAMDFGTKVHTALETRVRDGVVLPDEFAPYEKFAAVLDDHPKKVELKAGINIQGRACGFFDSEVWIRGKLDISIVYDQLATILDWKTGKSREDPDELEIFGVLLKAAQPQLQRITGHYVWLKEDKLGEPHDLSDTAVKLAQLRGRYEHIEKAARFKDYPAEQGPLCPWCPIKSCQFHPYKED